VLLPEAKAPATRRVRGCVGPITGLSGPFEKSGKSLTPSGKKYPESPAHNLVGVSNIVNVSNRFLKDVPVRKGRVG